MGFTQMLAPDNNDSLLNDLDPGTLYYARVLPIHGELSGEPGSDEERTGNGKVLLDIISKTPCIEICIDAINCDMRRLVRNWKITISVEDTKIK